MKHVGWSNCLLAMWMVLMSLSAVPVDAGDCPEFAGGWPSLYGPVSAVATSGDFAYIGVDRAMVVADISDPAHPVVVGAVALPFPASDIEVARSHAFVATERNGIRIIDVNTPDEPVEVGSYSPPRARVKGLAVDGHHLWVAAATDGLRVLDISRPSEPVVVASGSLSEVGGGSDIAVVGPYAYLATGLDLRIFNADLMNFQASVGYIKRPANRVAVGNGYAFLLAPSDGRLTAVDVSSPAFPVEAGVHNLGNFEHEGDLAVSERYLYVAFGQELHVLRADAPEMWWSLFPGSHDTGAGASDVVVVDDRAFLAAGVGGLQTLDVGSPMDPVEIGRLETLGTVLDAVVSDSLMSTVDCLYARVNDTQPQTPCKLRILDTLSTSPVELGSIGIPEVPVAIDVSDGHVFVLSDGGFRVIDVTDPQHPAEVSFDSWMGQEERALAVADGYAYKTSRGYAWGLFVADVGTPSSLEWVGHVEGDFTDLAVVDGFAYVLGSGDHQGLWVFDLSDPSTPTEMGHVVTPAYATRIAVADGFAYVTEGYAFDDDRPIPDPRLWIYDVSTPRAPILVGTHHVTGSYYEELVDIEARGGHVYLAVHRLDPSLKTVLYTSSGLRVVNVKDPMAPVGCGFHESAGEAQRLAMSASGDVILADGWTGIETLDVSSCSGFTPPHARARRSGGRASP